MKPFVAGFIAASLLACAVYLAFVDRADVPPRPGSSEVRVSAEAARHVASTGAPEDRPSSAPSSRAAGAIVGTPFSQGLATLRIGEGCVLATGEVRAGKSAASGDLTCVDIMAADLSIECPLGCTEPRLPLVLVGDQPTRDLCFERLLDAPAELTSVFTRLRGAPVASSTGVALVRTRAGLTFKVMVVEVVNHVRALERTATIRFEPVPVKPGGGRIQLEGQLDPRELSAAELEALRLMLKRPPVPGDSFKSMVGTAFYGVENLPDRFVMPQDTHLAVAATLQSDVTIPQRGSLYLPHGMGRRAKVALKSYSGVLIDGDMDGEINVESYGYLHITGNLNGTVHCRSNATVVIDGNIAGLLHDATALRLLLGGRFLDPTTGLDIDGGGWSTFYFHSFTSRAEIEAFPINRQFTLEVRDSDLGPGRHTGIGRWMGVIVADPLWQTLR